MDQQKVQSLAAEATDKVSTIAGDVAAQTGTRLQSKLDQGKAMIEDAREGAATLAHQASDVGRQAMAQAGEMIQGAARQASEQASQAATNIYKQSSRAGDVISRYAAEQPFTALLLAGAIGYGLAYFIHRR